MKTAATVPVYSMPHTDARFECRPKTAGTAANAKFERARSERPAERINSSRKPVRRKRPNNRKAAAKAAIAAVVSRATWSAGASYAKFSLATSATAIVAPADPSATPIASLLSRGTTCTSRLHGRAVARLSASPDPRFGYGGKRGREG